MQHRPFLVALSLALSLLPAASWAGDASAGTGLPGFRSDGNATALDTLTSHGFATDLIGRPTITSTEFVLHNQYLRLRDLRPDSEMPTTNGIRLSTPLLNGQLIAESEMAKNHATSDLMLERDRASSRSMMRFALSTHDGPFRYGLSYRMADQQFFNVPDQEIHEVWGEWGTGPLRVRSSVSEVFSNVDHDPSRPRSAQRGGRIMMALARPTWPEMSVTVARNLIDTNPLQSGLSWQRSIADTVEGALSLTRSSWNARLASSYTMNANDLEPGQDTISYAHILSGAFHPIEPLNITSVISYRTDVQQWTGVRTDTPVAALTIHYRHSAELMVSALGGYSGMRSSDGLTDHQSLSSRGIITWSPGGSTVTQVSFETGYTRTVTGGTANSGMIMQDLSGLVRVRLMQF